MTKFCGLQIPDGTLEVFRETSNGTIRWVVPLQQQGSEWLVFYATNPSSTPSGSLLHSPGDIWTNGTLEIETDQRTREGLLYNLVGVLAVEKIKFSIETQRYKTLKQMTVAMIRGKL